MRRIDTPLSEPAATETQCGRAVIYELGAGVEKNEGKAMQFHRKACQAGLSSACNAGR
jgi:TPR repeat protein